MKSVKTKVSEFSFSNQNNLIVDKIFLYPPEFYKQT